MGIGLCGLRKSENLVNQNCTDCKGRHKNNELTCDRCGSVKTCSSSMIFCNNCFDWDDKSVEKVDNERDNWYCYGCEFINENGGFMSIATCDLFNEELTYYDGIMRCEKCERFKILEQLLAEKEKEDDIDS